MKKKEIAALLRAASADIPDARTRFEEANGDDPATDIAGAVVIPVLDSIARVIENDEAMEPKKLSEGILALASLSVEIATPLLALKYSDGIKEAVKHASERE